VKLLIFIGANLFGSVGWWAGEYIGIMTAFIAAALGTVFGVYAGWWTARRLLDC
jgi:ABC-type sulfate transport system permease component